MTHAIWGILIGMTLMFGTSMQRYRLNFQRKAVIVPPDKQDVANTFRR